MPAPPIEAGQPCPCGSASPYDACCGRYHQGPLALQAPDPLSLMRSRYSAYVLSLPDYLLATWHPRTRPAFIEPSVPGLRWLGLDIRRHQHGGNSGVVEFVARSKLAGRAHRLHETSRFLREADRWYYLDGEIDT